MNVRNTGKGGGGKSGKNTRKGGKGKAIVKTKKKSQENSLCYF